MNALEGSYTPEFVGLEPGDTGVDRHVHFDVSSPVDAGGGKDSSAEIRVCKRPIEEGFPSVDDGMIVDKDPSEDTVMVDSDGARSMSRGSKRWLDDVPEDAESLTSEPMSRKRTLEQDGEQGGLMDVMLSEDFGYVCRLEEVSYKFLRISGKCSLWCFRENKMPR